MTKAELVKAVAEEAAIAKGTAGWAINAFCRVVRNANKVDIRGFGTFEKKTRAARKGRNPQTGAEIDIPAKEKMTFRASKIK